MTRKQKIAIGITSAVLIIVGIAGLKIRTIQGHQMGVLETWGGGVIETPLKPKTYIWFPFGFKYRIYPYDMSSQVYVMNDIPSTEEFAQGREKDSYDVQSKEGQNMRISLNVRWRLDPDKLIHIHKYMWENFQEKVLRPSLLRAVKDEATIREAIVAYSGPGLVDLQKSIQQRLTDPDGDVRTKGIIIENFVIEGIQLDPEYIGQIKDRQVAVQRELKAKQEEIAALAEAAKAKAEEQANYERAVVQAERDKAVGILKAEKEAQVRIVDAEAKKREVVFQSEADKMKQVLVAEGGRATGPVSFIRFFTESTKCDDSKVMFISCGKYPSMFWNAFAKDSATCIVT